MPTDERPDLPQRAVAFSVLDSVYAALRRRVPQITAYITTTGAPVQERCIVVAHRDRGPWRLVHDGSVIRWYDGPARGLPIGFVNRIETTADAIGSMMGAAVRGNPPAPF